VWRTYDADMDVDLPICQTCGVQYPAPRDDCPICLDERQYVGWQGQRWTSLAEMAASGHRGEVTEQGPGVVGIGTTPSFAIGQRALLVRAPGGNVLWDCVSYLDDALVGQVRQLGGIDAIAISHPHFYGSMIEWAHAFGAPVYIHAADREWIAATRPDDAVVFWEGETRQIGEGLTLINAGVHFDGGQVLHWRDADARRGALFSGDIFQVVRDRRWVSFMYSYPNLIPERPRTIRRALALIEPFRFERVYGAWSDLIVGADGAEAVQRSADRYLRFALDDAPPPQPE
jgi:glyoxylase-like metal-dependent hydrolase (beta-lactamase superfamily II)